MRLRNFNNRFTENIVDISKRQPARTKSKSKIIKRQIARTSKDVLDWRKALNEAESVHNPNRARLQIVYDDVLIDGHVNGIMNSIKNKIKSKEFMIVNESDGSEDEEATKLFETEWFFKYEDLVIEADFFGYTLIELGDIVDDAFPEMLSVNRRHIVPEWNIVKQDVFATSREDGFDYLAPENANWYIFVGDINDMGLLNIVSPHALAKKNILSSAWEHAELFGMPIRLGKTDIDDEDRRQSMERMFDNMGSSAWAVVDLDDEVEFIQGSRSDPHRVFTEPVKMANQEMSKALAGQLGVFDEKSFVGSAEVGERLFHEFIMSDSRRLKFNINNELIPRMVFHRMLPAGRMFVWKAEETLSTKDKIQAVKDLSLFYVISPEEVTAQTGIQVEALKNTVPGMNPGDDDVSSEEVTSVMSKVLRLYENVM